MPPSLAYPVQVIEYPDHAHWSAAAAAELARCPRAYYWSTTTPPAAEPGPPPPEVIPSPIGPLSAGQAAWALRHLTTLPRLVETVVRQAAAYVLRALGAGSAPPGEAALVDGAGLTLNQTWLGSTTAARVADGWRAPWGAPLLEEFVVGGGLTAVALDAAKDGVRSRISALLAHPLLAEFRRSRSRPYLVGGLGEPFLAAPGVVVGPPRTRSTSAVQGATACAVCGRGGSSFSSTMAASTPRARTRC